MSTITSQQSGIVQGKEGGTVILLPAGPIRSTVEGASGVAYEQVLVDDPELGQPVHRIQAADVVYSYTE